MNKTKTAFKSNFAKLGLLALLTSSALYAGTYNIDPTHSSVGFKVKHMMISNVSGKFGKINGSFEYDDKTNSIKSLTGKIDVNSINTDNVKRDAHLKSVEIFNAKKYPNISFSLKKIEKDSAFGELTIHGVTKNVELDFENNGQIKDPWGNTRVGLAISGKINRKDYGIVWNQILEAGGVAVGEIVKLDIELEGILSK